MSSTISEDKKAVQVGPASSPQGSFVDIIDPEVEKRLVRKLDLNIVPLIMVMQMISFLDRSNIGNAKVNGLVKDLHLTGTDFNGKWFTSCPVWQPGKRPERRGNKIIH
jgi:hypothetical protein